VTNDPEDSRPLAMEGGVVVGDGKGGKKKVMTMEDVTPNIPGTNSSRHCGICYTSS